MPSCDKPLVSGGGVTDVKITIYHNGVCTKFQGTPACVRAQVSGF